MSASNWERVGKGLELLRDGLVPFVEQELKAEFGKEQWLMEARQVLRDERDLKVVKGKPRWEVLVLLVVMWEHWHRVFKKTLGHAERSLVSELRTVRNDWAHQQPFTTDDAYRAYDSMHRLLKAVSAPQASEIDRMRRLIDQYLVLGELSQRPLCMRFEAIDASALISDIVERIGLWAGDEPQCYVETGLRMWGDRTRLEQVFWNLLQNAYRYGKRPVQVTAWAEDGYARIVVSDCGPGIPEEHRIAAQAMFKQGANADYEGLGIGLGLPAAIIRAHGGRQWIESAPCGGAAIHFQLERVS